MKSSKFITADPITTGTFTVERIEKPNEYTINWNPEQYKVTNIDFEKCKITFERLDKDE